MYNASQPYVYTARDNVYGNYDDENKWLVRRSGACCCEDNARPADAALRSTAALCGASKLQACTCTLSILAPAAAPLARRSTSRCPTCAATARSAAAGSTKSRTLQLCRASTRMTSTYPTRNTTAKWATGSPDLGCPPKPSPPARFTLVSGQAAGSLVCRHAGGRWLGRPLGFVPAIGPCVCHRAIRSQSLSVPAPCPSSRQPTDPHGPANHEPPHLQPCCQPRCAAGALWRLGGGKRQSQLYRPAEFCLPSLFDAKPWCPAPLPHCHCRLMCLRGTWLPRIASSCATSPSRCAGAVACWSPSAVLVIECCLCASWCHLCAAADAPTALVISRGCLLCICAG